MVDYPSSCKHPRQQMISLRAGGGGNIKRYRHRIALCPDCGEFCVHGHQNGERFKVRFTLSIAEQVEAAGTWARFMDEQDEANKNGGGGRHQHRLPRLYG